MKAAMIYLKTALRYHAAPEVLALQTVPGPAGGWQIRWLLALQVAVAWRTAHWRSRAVALTKRTGIYGG